MRPFSFKLAALLLALLVLAGNTLRVAAAEAREPWQAAEQLRQSLFDAQRHLLLGDDAAAVPAIEGAQATFEAELAPTLASAAPDAHQRIAAGLRAADEATRRGDAGALAGARGQVWGGLLRAGYDLALGAVAQNDAAEAQRWLRLREFRAPTRFSRPGADATLALLALRDGAMTPDEAAAALRTDLLDTYQARLGEALAALDQSAEQGFVAQRAEAATLAQGYWALLAPAYEAQRGGEARAAADAVFARLVAAVETNDAGALTGARADVEETLRGFRAAPLSAEEQARRAGQMLRFLALVPVEYGRGVRNGQVTLDIEIQEAVTFRNGAAAAFDDLRVALDELDAAASAEVAAHLAELDTILQDASRRAAVAEPRAVQATTEATLTLLRDLLPAEWQRANSASDADVLASVLDGVESAVAAGQYAQAESARLEGYAIVDMGIEPRLMAFSPPLVAQLDGLFWHGYQGQRGLAEAIASRASLEEIRAVRASLDATVAEAQRVLGDGPRAPLAIVGNASLIVFREGLEAVLILASITASMVGANRHFRRPLVVGAVGALVASALTWWLAQGLLTSLRAYGEKLEAVVSLVAIGVLLLITNWFFHKVYWTGWIATFHARKRRLLGAAAGQFVGLMVLGFTSVYREGFETVLFLQALVLDAGAAVVLKGVALGMLGVAAVGVAMFALQTKLPYKKMLIVTGVLIGGVLLMMVGTTVHVMQAVGWMPITPIHGLSLPYWAGLWLGLFPTWQGVLAQVAAGAFVIGSYILAERQRRVAPAAPRAPQRRAVPEA